MKKAKLFGSLLCTACLIAGSLAPSIPVMADSVKVVTLGADLTEDQKNTMLRYFNVSTNEVQILTITNQDEREHLSAYVPIEQIGTRTVSCAYVKPTDSGGIKVRTANLNWVTCNMIASSLSTSGVKNCEVIAACPFEVSGTGALTGIQMAYETASGETLDETKKELATEEMVVTGNLADQVGQDEATIVINESKMDVISENIQSADEIYNVVVNVAQQNGVDISEDQIDTIVSLLEEIAQQDYDYAEMEETLERVNDNATGETDTTVTESDPDSIVNDVDESVLGNDIIVSSTEDPSLSGDVTTSDVSSQEGGTESQGDVVIDESQGDVIIDESQGDEIIDEGTAEDPSYDTEEITDVSQLNTDFLGEEARALFEKAKTFCQGEYEGDAAALQEVMGEDAICEVLLDEETSKKLSAKVLETYLGILGNGTGSYVSTGDEKYFTTELNMLEDELKVIFGIELTEEELAEEDADILGDLVSAENKEILYKDTMKFFEKLYNESYEEIDTAAGTAAAEDTSGTTEGTAEGSAETYDETAAETTADETYDEELIYDEEMNMDETIME